MCTCRRVALLLLLAMVVLSPGLAQQSAWNPTGMYTGNFINVRQCATGGGTFYLMATTGSQVFRSGDNGVTWTEVTAEFDGHTVYSFVYWTATLQYYTIAGTSAGTYRTNDGGFTWTQQSVIPTTVSVYELFSPGGGRLLAGTNDGIYYSHTYDQAFAKLANPPVTAAYSFCTYTLYGTTTVYCGTSDGVWTSPGGSYGASWTELNNTETDNKAVKALVLSGSNLVAAVWNGGTGLGLYKAPRSTAWVVSNSGLGNLNVNALGISTNAYAATDGGLYESTDASATWHEYNSGLPAGPVKYVGPAGSAAYCCPNNGGVYKKGAPILTPTLISPPNNATDVPVPSTLTWSYPVGVTSYDVQYSTTSNFATGTVTVPSVLAPTLDVPGLNPSYNYYWRVRANTNGWTTNYSAGFKFTTADFAVAPTVPTAIAFAPTSPLTVDNLTATASGSVDYNPADTVSYEYEWRVSNNAGVSYGAWGYPAQILDAANTQRGQKWQCHARATDGLLQSAWYQSPTVITIGNTGPTAPTAIATVPSLNPAPTTNQDIVATASGATDADSDSIVYQYEWAVSFDSGATFSDWIPFGATLPAAATEEGDVWKVRARAGDGYLNSAWYESGSTVPITRPNIAPTAPSAIAFTPPAPQTADNILATASGATDLDSDPLTYSYEWSVSTDNGATWSPWSYAGDTLAAANTFAGQFWKCHARAFDGLAYGPWFESTSLAISNAPPTSPTSAAVAPLTPDTTQDLTATADGATDPDGNPITYQFEWRYTTDAGTTWSPWGNPGATLAASVTVKGQTWEMWARATDGDGFSAWYTCPTQVTILNSGPTDPGVPAIAPASPGDADDLVATPGGSTDPDSDPITYAGDWAVSTDGGTTWSPWSAANTSNNGLTLLAAATTLGERWKARVQASDGTVQSAWVESLPVGIGNTGPTAPTAIDLVPASPATTDDVVATASGATDVDNDPLTYSYEWAVSTDGGTTWGAWGNPGGTLPATATTTGERWKCRAQASDGTATSAWYESPTILSIGNTAPTAPTTADVAPASADTSMDLTATASGATDADNDPLTYEYEWRYSTDGGTTWTPWGNPGATLLAALTTRGQTWQMWARANDGTTVGPWYTCPNTVTIANAIPTDPTAPAITPANPITTDDLSVTPAGSTDADTDPLTYAVEWSVSTDGGTTWGAFGTANTTHNGATLLAAATTKGEQWKARVQASDGTVTSAWVESAPTIIADAVPTAPAIAVAPRIANTDLDLTATATGSTDADGDAVTYEYEWASRTSAGIWSAWGNAGNVLNNTVTSNGEWWKARARATAAAQSSAWVESAEVEVNTLLSSTAPLNGAGGVNRYATITLNFRWGVSRPTAEAAFSLTPAGGTAVAGTFAWTGFNNVIFTPSAPLAAGTAYTVALAPGIMTKTGLNITWAESFTFTTNLGPIVVSATPTGTNVPVNTQIRVTFDQMMHRVSATTAFSISRNVQGTFAWANGVTELIFTPNANLGYNRSYTVTMGAATRAANGLTLGKNYSFSFTTAAAPALAMAATAAGTTRGPVAIEVNLSAAASVEMNVMNLAGRVVATVPAQDVNAGASTLLWDGRSSNGTAVPSGNYLVRMTAHAGDGQTSECLVPLRR